ncbi:hypothetical protein [Mycobacterium tuberculosis]|uniref:hypothetical protein n=1 Tax=Mycobacterium tuberculosis TaxID=1773 RepID=UPI00272A7DD1|nr:hypothetical protein [Mycobacterium tuberculosis]
MPAEAGDRAPNPEDPGETPLAWLPEAPAEAGDRAPNPEDPGETPLAWLPEAPAEAGDRARSGHGCRRVWPCGY